MAATRFYFGYIIAASVSPGFDAGWEQISQRKKLIYKNDFTVIDALSDGSISHAITTTQDYLMYQMVSNPIPPQRLTGTFSMVIRCGETNAGSNATLAAVVRVVSQDGGTVRGTLFSNYSQDTEFPLSASAATRIVNAQAITPLTTQPGDRIVVEIGFHVAAPSVNNNVQMRAGFSASSDFALTSGLTTDLNPWCEFSQDLFNEDNNNYKRLQSANAGIISIGVIG